MMRFVKLFCRALEKRINSDPQAALLVVDMLIHEGKKDRAKVVIQQNKSKFNPAQLLQAKLYIGQIYFNEQKIEDAREVAFDLLSQDEARESSTIMRGVLDILTFEGPDDPPFRLDVMQMNEVLTQLEQVMKKHHLVTDFMRLIKKWAVHVWEQMNIDNHKSNKRNTGVNFDQGDHFTFMVHPFIVTFGKLEQAQSELFESQFTLLRKDILLLNLQSLPMESDTVASMIAHQTMFNQGMNA